MLWLSNALHMYYFRRILLAGFVGGKQQLKGQQLVSQSLGAGRPSPCYPCYLCSLFPLIPLQLVTLVTPAACYPCYPCSLLPLQLVTLAACRARSRVPPLLGPQATSEPL